MALWYNSRGQGFHSSSAGTYRINNGDPQNDYDENERENEEKAEAGIVDDEEEDEPC